MDQVLILIIILVTGIGLVFGVGIFLLRDVFFAAENVSSRLSVYAALPDSDTPHRDIMRRRAGLVRLRLRLNSMLSILASESLNMQLLTANWPITETEFVLIRIWATIIALGLGWLVSGMVISGLGLALIAYMVPGLLLNRAIHNRRLRFERQLIDVLMLITGAVRAGYSLPQALEVVSREMRAPASEEFRRVRHEIGLGLSLSQALANLVARMNNDDLYLVVTAININAQVGGNLVTMLQAVTSTIRERVRLFAEVRALTAQQRFGSYILTFLPIGVAGALFALNPTYMSRLFEPQSLCIPIGAAINVILGNIAIRRLAKIDV